MGMMTRLASALGLKQTMAGAPEAEQIMAALLPSDVRLAPERGVQGMLDAYSRSPWVRAVSSKVAQAVGSVQWQLYATRSEVTRRYLRSAALQARGVERGAYRRKLVDLPEGVELVQVVDHPLLGLLNNAAMAFPGNVGRTLTQLYLELTGEAFWLLEADVVQGRLVPMDFWLVPPTWVKAVPTSDRKSFRLEPAGSSTGIDVPMELVVWFVDPNPVNPYKRGTGLLRALGDEIDTDEFASKHVRSWFYNSARPDLLVYGEGLGKADTDRLEAKWMQRVGGFLNRHKPLFLGAAVQVKELSQKFSDMQLTELRRWERDVIVHTVGMPPEVLGIIESSNRATIDAADYLFAKHVVEPRLEFFRAYLQTHLVPMYDERLVLGYESPVEENADYQLEVAKAAPWALAMDEWRCMAGLDPLPDDRGQVHLLKLNEQLVPTGQVGTPVPTQPPTGASIAAPVSAPNLPPYQHMEEGAETRHSATSQGISGDAAPLVSDHGAGCTCGAHAALVPAQPDPVATAWADAVALAVVQRQVGGPAVQALAEQFGPQLVDDLMEAFHALAGELDVQAVVAALERGDLAAAVAVVDRLPATEAFEDARQTMRAALLTVGDAAAAELAEVLGEPLSFELLNPAALQELEQFGAGMVTNVTDETIEALRRLLVAGYDQGYTPQEIARQMRDSLGLTTAQVEQRKRLYEQWLAEGMSVEDANAKLERWVKKKIKERAEIIATNELKYAGNRGQEMLWEAAQQGGLLPKENVKRKWILTNDEHLCRLCGAMVGERALTNIGEPWETDKGAVYTPQDIHVRCRCAERLVFIK